MNFILICVTLDLSDNLTEMRIVKNPNTKYKIHIRQFNQTPAL